MHIKRMHEIIETLTETAACEIGKGVECVDTKEFGEVIEMIEELAKAEYYARLAKCIEKDEKEEIEKEKYLLKMLKEEYGEDDGKRYYDMWRYKSGRFAPRGKGERYVRRGYDEPPYYHVMPDHDAEYRRDLDRHDGRMYYTEPIRMEDKERMRDGREGRSGMSRRAYMETKELHKSNTPEDKQHKMRELEKYMGELSGDISEMISDASPEERSLLKQKLQVLAQKIQ